MTDVNNLSEGIYPCMKESIETPQCKIPLFYSGIRLGKNKSIIFNFNKNNSNSDILRVAGDISRDFDSDNIRYIYGYTFSPNVSDSDKKAVRNYINSLKESNKLVSDNICEFVDRGVLSLETCCSFRDFGAFVPLDHHKDLSIIDAIGSYFSEYLRDCHYIDLDILKRIYENVEHEEIQQNRSDFLQFKTENERKTYQSLQGVNVLAFNVFFTNDATFREIARYLKTIHAKNTLTVFILIKEVECKEIVKREVENHE